MTRTKVALVSVALLLAVRAACAVPATTAAPPSKNLPSASAAATGVAAPRSGLPAPAAPPKDAVPAPQAPPKGQEAETRWSGAPPVSLFELIALPTRFDGRTIAVEGYLSTGSKESYLFATKEDADYCSHQNAIRVSFSKKVDLIPDNAQHFISWFDHQRVFLFGKFIAKNKELLYVERVASVKRFYDGVRTIQVDRTRLETPKPDTNKSDASKPDATNTESPKPDASKPDLPKPDATKPGKSKKRGSLLNQQ